MSNVFNHEANLQILSDVLGFGGYHSKDGTEGGLKGRIPFQAQPSDIELLVSADDMLIPASDGSGMSERQVLGTFIHQLDALMKV